MSFQEASVLVALGFYSLLPLGGVALHLFNRWRVSRREYARTRV